MPKLAIYIPKSEMKQIERWRKKLNFSRIFMQALSREINLRSREAPLDADKLAKAAAFYGSQLAADHQQIADSGFATGQSHVLDCELSAESIRELVKIDSSELGDEKVVRRLAELLGPTREKVSQAMGELREEHQITEQTHPAWKRAFHEGYLAGIQAAWKQVCQAVAGNLGQLMYFLKA